MCPASHIHCGGSVGVHLALMPHGNRSHGSGRENNLIRYGFRFHSFNLLTFAFVSVGSVQEERRWTDTFSRLNAFLIRSTFPIGAATLLGRCAKAVVSIATVAVGTNTIISAGLVEAIRSIATHLTSLGAFIDVDTSTISLGPIALWTRAVAQTPSDGDAFGSFGTLSAVIATSQDALATDKLVRRLALTFQATAFFARDIRIAIESGRTITFIAAW